MKNRTVLHVKTGKKYHIVNTAIINATNEQSGQTMALYQDIKTLQLFVREQSEFMDGRFIEDGHPLVEHLRKEGWEER